MFSAEVAVVPNARDMTTTGPAHPGQGAAGSNNHEPAEQVRAPVSTLAVNVGGEVIYTNLQEVSSDICRQFRVSPKR